MKLGNLNAAIDAAPAVLVRFSWGAVEVRKGSLKAALKAHHDGQRAAETGLTLTDDGFLSWEQERGA